MKSSSIVHFILHTDLRAVNFDDIYAMKFSIISMGLIVFFFGISMLFLEFLIYRIAAFKVK